MSKSKQLSTLSFAVRPRLLVKHLSQLGFVLAALQLVPAAAGLAFGETGLALTYGLTTTLLAGICLPGARMDVPEAPQVNEALVVSVLAFAVAAAANVPPFLVAGLATVDALFEAVSAVTTTGLSTLASVESMPQTFLFGRAWAQWYGGLGIVVLSLALLAGHGVALRRLVDPERAGEDLGAAIRTYARGVLFAYSAATAAGIAALFLVGVPLFHAAIHALAGISTGGFSSFDASLAALPPVAAYILVMLAVAGAISLPLYFLAFERGWGAFLRDPEPAALLISLTLLVALLTLSLHYGSGLELSQALYHGGLLALSAHTTTGFASLELGSLPGLLLALLILAMAIGGSLGSTSGGIKLMRVLILLRLIGDLIGRASVPSRAVIPHWWGNRRIESPETERILLFILLFVLLVLFSWLPFLALGYPPLPALFDIVSATATTGLSTGIVGPDLPPGLKLLLCFDMLAGRVEIIAVLVLLYPRTWFGRHKGYA